MVDNTLQAIQRFISIQPIHESNSILQYKLNPRSMRIRELFVFEFDKLPLLRGKIREDTAKKWQWAGNEFIFSRSGKQHRMPLILGEQQEKLANEFSTQ